MRLFAGSQQTRCIESRLKCLKRTRWLRMNSRKRSRWITFAAVTAVAVGAVAFWPGEKEPEYQGKKTSQWIEQYRSGQEHERAVAAIHAIGTNALPLLVRWLKHVPWHQRQGEIFLAVLPVKIQEELSLTGWEHNSMAVRGFEVLGPQAAPAIPALCQ